MIVNISYSKYLLEGAQVPGSREGALLRFCFAEGVYGYSDCHPWPELGDDALDVQLDSLRVGCYSTLGQRCLAMAHMDARARRCAIPLFPAGEQYPRSQFLIHKLTDHSADLAAQAYARGFTHFKVKIQQASESEAEMLAALAARCELKSHTLRLDFNEKFAIEELEFFLDKLFFVAPSLRSALDFFEDPLPWDSVKWAKLRHRWRVQLACDRSAGSAAGDYAADVIVIKPAIVDPIPIVAKLHAGQRLVVTSYLDHPIGQLAAARCAWLLRPNEVHGLATHHIWHPTVWSASLGLAPRILPQPGTGWGYDALLPTLEWLAL